MCDQNTDSIVLADLIFADSETVAAAATSSMPLTLVIQPCKMSAQSERKRRAVFFELQLDLLDHIGTRVEVNCLLSEGGGRLERIHGLEAES